MSCRDVTEKIKSQIAAGFPHHSQEVRSHQKELAHTRYVEHLGMNCDEHGCSRAQGAQGQEPELRRTIDNHHIVIFFDSGQGRFYPCEEDVFAPSPTLSENPWASVLEFVQFYI